jgi:hypothetical protein
MSIPLLSSCSLTADTINFVVCVHFMLGTCGRNVNWNSQCAVTSSSGIRAPKIKVIGVMFLCSNWQMVNWPFLNHATRPHFCKTIWTNQNSSQKYANQAVHAERNNSAYTKVSLNYPDNCKNYDKRVLDTIWVFHLFLQHLILNIFPSGK